MHKHAYRLLTESPAKKTAKKLIGIVELMGFRLKLSRAQEIVAALMGYQNWAELHQVTKTAPERGIPDQMLHPKAAIARQRLQIATLVHEFDVDESVADGLLEALAPTRDNSHARWAPMDKMGLRLAEEDLDWLNESMSIVRKFDAAVRPLYSLAHIPSAESYQPGLTHVKVQRTIPGSRERRIIRNTSPQDIVEWVLSTYPDQRLLTGEKRSKVQDFAEQACDAFTELDSRIRGLGAAPMLAPIDWTFLMLYRSHVFSDAKSFFTALSPEPWLHIGFDLPKFCFNPENEWNASRALSIQLALRREFLDAGWTDGGPEWNVTFRDGNSAKEQVIVRASSSGAAFAWVAASRAALRIAKHQNVGNISLLAIEGLDGPRDIEQTVANAKNETIILRRRLIDPSRLHTRGRKKAA